MTYQACKIADVNIGRVNQVWKDNQETKAIPEIGKKNGRPTKPFTDEGINMIKEVYKKYKSPLQLCEASLTEITALGLTIIAYIKFW